jgi:iron complex outermembrane receptor protein
MVISTFPSRGGRLASAPRIARALLILLGLFPGIRAVAAGLDALPDTNKIVLLPEVVIVGKPILEDTRLDSLAGVVTLVTARQIVDLNALDLPSALRRIPGVVISRYNLVGSYGGGDGGSVYLRGLGSGRPGAEIGTLFDGVPRFVGVWTHPLMDALSLDSAAGIEVRKSAQPVLEGNMAFGSVNMVPRRRESPGYETSIRGMVGRFETRSGEIRHGGRTGNLDYYLSAGQNRSDGARAHARGRTESIYGRVGFELAPGWDWSFQVDHTGGDVQDPGSTASPWPLDDPSFRVPSFGTDTELYLATMPHRVGSAAGEAKVYLDHGRLDWWQWGSPVFGQPPESFRSITDYDNYGLRIHESFPLPAAVRLLVGYDQEFYGGTAQEKRASGDGPKIKHLFRNRAPYLSASKTIPAGGEGWRVTPTAGARFNDSRFFGSDWGWQAGVSATRGRSRIHAQHGRAFNLPGVYVATLYDGWERRDEWKHLRAEILDHNEVGFRAGLMPGIEFGVDAFYDEIRSALRWVPPVIPPPPPFQPPRFANSGRWVNRGVETSVTADARAGSLFLGLSLMRPMPDDLPNAPHWSVDAGLNARVTRAIGLSADVDWSAAQTVLNPRFAAPSDYRQPTSRVGRRFLLNARLSYAFVASGARSEVFLAGENLTGAKYEYRPGYPMPPATWMSGIQIGF